MLFKRKKKVEEPYCIVCDSYHPVDGIRYSGQRLCHIAFGKPLPYLEDNS